MIDSFGYLTPAQFVTLCVFAFGFMWLVFSLIAEAADRQAEGDGVDSSPQSASSHRASRYVHEWEPEYDEKAVGE